MKVIVSLLSYNEAESIGQTVSEGYQILEKTGLDFELWVFDNHSSDSTPQIMSELQKTLPRLRSYRQSQNVGYAGSTLSSMKVPVGDIYVTLDGDGQFSLADVPKMIVPLSHGFDIVVGWRVQRNDPWDRLIMNWGFNFVSKLILNCKIHDLNCGYRAINKKAANLITVAYKEKFVGPEIFARAIQNGLRVTQTPVAHFERRAGVSVYSGDKLASVLRMLGYLFKLRKVTHQKSEAVLVGSV